ncbi:MAG: cupin domain-containing protein [Patescibacteria group bacterium]
MSQKLVIHEDSRGKLVEIFKVPDVGQVFYATSTPGAIRGNHYHTRKKEYFCVIEGRGKIRMRDRHSGEKKEYLVSGDAPEVAEMPLNWTHHVENVGEKEMKLIVWVDEVYNPEDPDTYAERV